MTVCKRRLASLWFVGGGILLLLVILQTLLGGYGDKSGDAFGWLLPNIVPTLSLIIGVLVSDALGKGLPGKEADRFLFRLSFGLSCAYLSMSARAVETVELVARSSSRVGYGLVGGFFL